MLPPATRRPLSVSLDGPKKLARPASSPHAEAVADPPQRASYVPNIPEPAKVSLRGRYDLCAEVCHTRAY
jgi:hypothetical protein